MSRESFVFYQSFHKALEPLPPESYKNVMTSILEYALIGKEPELEGIEQSFFILIKPQIDANQARYENGKNGGRPKKTEQEPNHNQDITEPKPKDNQAITEQEPNHNQDITEPKPKDNQAITELEPNHNQDITEPKPKDNQAITELEPNVNVNENDTVNVNEKEFTNKLPETTEQQTFSTANAVVLSQTSLVPKQNKLPGRKKQELTPQQLVLYQAAKVCFESSEKAKAMIYQDPASTGRELNHLKTFAVRCSNMAPGMEPEFLKTVLEHFKIMCNGKYHGKMVFTPQNLITPWVWALVIESLPVESEVTNELRETIRGLFS